MEPVIPVADAVYRSEAKIARVVVLVGWMRVKESEKPETFSCS